MTASHVHALDEISVEFVGGETVTARIVASEPAADLSLLQLDRVPPGTSAATMADTNTVRVGDPVIVVGAPYGLSYSLSVGHISAHWAPKTVYPTMPLAEFFQTDAVINTGNSGGPMFSMKGEVVGLGFVVTLNTAKQLLLEKKSFWSGLTRIREALGRLSSGAAFKATILRAGEVLELTGHAPDHPWIGTTKVVQLVGCGELVAREVRGT
jgi:serine protease Do